MLYIFSGCLAFGIFYSIISLILGGHHGGSADTGGHDLGGHDLVGHDAGLHTSAANAAGNHMNAGNAGAHAAGSHDTTNSNTSGNSTEIPSPFNPLVIASSITTFGAIGLIGKLGFKMGDLPSSIFALAFAGTAGAILFFGVVKLMYGSQSNSTFSLYDLLETEAEVITPLPEEGMGEIAYIAGGIRYSMPAKSISGENIERGDRVIIKDFSGNTALVTRKITIEDLELFNTEDSGNAGGETETVRIEKEKEKGNNS